MISVLPSNMVDRVFKPCLGQAKHYKIVICCFYAKHAAHMIKAKIGWLMIMLPNGAICRNADHDFSELAL